ncbi:hypothetical protein EVG20_g2836 [Dentipellis fragilis]|uniref:Origin recognition complex subunit 4 n=1 Tax=Dentipellis fragilis TaxID=205917 RepID=A0A4Y9Z7Q8_9AGAM|nr:hypothetical protein EVG20_g2836 [Dentipellis fragilis]
MVTKDVFVDQLKSCSGSVDPPCQPVLCAQSRQHYPGLKYGLQGTRMENDERSERRPGEDVTDAPWFHVREVDGVTAVTASFIDLDHSTTLSTFTAMPPKRKAPSTPSAPEPSLPRRRLRSNAQTSSPTHPAVPTIRRGPPRKPAASKVTGVRNADVSQKHNPLPDRHTSRLASQSTPPASIEGSDESDADELLLSPSKSHNHVQRNPSRKLPRIVMHSVEIVLPRRHHSRIQRDDKAPQPSTRPAQPKDVLEEPAVTSTVFPAPLPLQVSTNGTVSPSRKSRPLPSPGSPVRPTHSIPTHYSQCLQAQKGAALAALRNSTPARVDGQSQEEASANTEALRQLRDLLVGTIDRGEGNSCLLVGPRGSGKSQVIEEALNSFTQPPIVIRLSGHVQHNDRLAMREIARQIAKQTGRIVNTDGDPDEVQEDNPFLDETSAALPPPSHLPTLISALPTFSRPTVVVLDAFDLFALHGRQALLYCLLDTAQSCRATKDTKGIVVIGATSRVDTINLLEKRVKSRFSGRTLRTAAPQSPQDWLAIARRVLRAPIKTKHEDWTQAWSSSVDQFLADHIVVNLFKETFGLTRDVRKLCQILTDLAITLSPTKPFPTIDLLIAAIAGQRAPHPFPILSSLSYPCMCLLVAAVHTGTAGHDSMTFEMLHESFRLQLRTSLSAPVQVEGGGIGMVRCSREVLMTSLKAFEQLITARVFAPIAAASGKTQREFLKYKCMAERDDIKKAIEASGQTNLRKWFNKAQ